MDALSWLSKGAEAVRRMGPQEFFEMFYDWVDDENPSWPWPKGAPDTMTAAEVDAVTGVLAVVNAAVVEIDDYDDVDPGWLERISQVAGAALDLMLLRGCFDEEREEREPSNRALEAGFRDDAG